MTTESPPPAAVFAEFAFSADYMQEIEMQHLAQGCIWSVDLPWGERHDRAYGVLLSDATDLALEHLQTCSARLTTEAS